MRRSKEYNIGEIYGNVKLINLFRHGKDNRLMATVVCLDCGREKSIRASDLYDSKYTSCKCKKVKHGKSDSKLYSIYSNMKDRCLNPNNHAYKHYGGRGIKINKEWLKDFKYFFEWSINNGYKEGLSIDRIDVNGGYEPSNCRWVTLSENISYANKTNARRKADKGNYYGISPQGNVYYFSNANQFSDEHGLNANGIRRVARGERPFYKGWKFGYICDL